MTLRRAPTIRQSRVVACVGGAMLAAVAVLLSATPAEAHVTVHPAALPTGSTDAELTFRVPNERDTASTVGVQVFFPTDLPLLSVNVLPVTGWTDKVTLRTLAAPVSTDDGTVSQVVSDITWRATGGGIAPGQYENFVIAVGRGPGRTGSAIFKTLQTYSSGEVVRWIQVTSPSDPRPDSPAPVLTITRGPSSAVTATPTTDSSTGGETLAVAALAVSLLALVATGILVMRRREPARSNVSAGREDRPVSGG